MIDLWAVLLEVLAAGLVLVWLVIYFTRQSRRDG
jgi:hypothetical protein